MEDVPDPTVVIDTNIALAAGTLEFMVRIAAAGGVRLVWSDDIAAEIVAKLPVRGDRVQERVQAAMSAVEDAVVPVIEADHDLAAGHCDVEDEHVLAAAIAARRLDPDGDIVLLTSNLKDFVIGWAAEQGIRVLKPDQLGMEIVENRPQAILSFVAFDPEEYFARYLDRMKRAKMTNTAAAVRQLQEDLQVDD